MQLVFVGNYPPRLCGISTFTKHLADGMVSATETRKQAYGYSVTAINDGSDYAYPREVTRTIEQHNRKEYLQAASQLNHGNVDAVVIQHEFGIFGGDAGSFIVDFAERLRKPLIVTMHTVLRQPDAYQRLVVERLARLADRLVVMSDLAVRILHEVYRIPSERIACIEHGAPAFDYGRREGARGRFGLGDRRTLLTFGLLGRGKGIETAIEALPAVKELDPDFLYILLGKTHPHVVKHEGEAYRESLWARVEELGLADNVRFADEYVDEETLADYLLATDIYVIPYPNEAQITSGTLAYAVGAGCAVVSTPFWHAKELLADDRGILFPFNDSKRLGGSLRQLIEDPELLKTLRTNALTHGTQVTWANQGARYLDVLRTVMEEHRPQRKPISETKQLAAPDHQHILRLSDGTGMLQHATFHLPNRKEGYCLDDNARALIYVAQALEAGGSPAELEPLLDNYLSLLEYLQCSDGRFHNFIGYDRNYLDLVGSEDSFGRAVWSLCYVLQSAAVSQDHKEYAWQLYLSARPHIARLRSLRAVAFCVIGLELISRCEQFSEGVKELIASTAPFITEEYARASDSEWDWFESVLTYGNAILPLSVLLAGRVLQRDEYIDIARKTTAFLERYTFEERMIRPIGCHGFMRRGEEPNRYDQQPLDAMAMVYLYGAWYDLSGYDGDLHKAVISYEWFTGRNDVGLPLFNSERGSCFDGLMERGRNRNQGAESTLAFWLARYRLAELLEKSNSQDKAHPEVAPAVETQRGSRLRKVNAA